MGVPLSVGKVIVSTRVPHESAVLEAIRQFGLELQVIFNKGAVMIVPAGHNKASGLAAALDKMGLSPHNVVGIGDAENDHAFLDLCGCGVAVANALPMVKEKADFVTQGDHGLGVAELANEIVDSDLVEREDLLVERHLLLAHRGQDAEPACRPCAPICCWRVHRAGASRQSSAACSNAWPKLIISSVLSILRGFMRISMEWLSWGKLTGHPPLRKLWVF